MIAGLPAATWALMVAATAPGLAVVLISFRAHRREGAEGGEGGASGNSDASDSPGRRA